MKITTLLEVNFRDAIDSFRVSKYEWFNIITNDPIVDAEYIAEFFDKLGRNMFS